jgi:hypothetical protein
MKLSNETLAVLKNFSTINSGLLFKQGSTISTVSSSKTVLAQAILKDQFPQEFAIYDLPNFLSVLSLGKDTPELDFDDKHVYVKSLGGRSKIKYRVTEKHMIVTPPEKMIVLPSVEISFELSSDDYDWIMRTANVLQSPNVAVVGDGNKLKITSYDTSNDAAHANSIDLGDTDKEFRAVFKTENLKMIPGVYQVDISSKGVAHFKNVKDSIEYWIATEKDATNFKG